MHELSKAIQIKIQLNKFLIFNNPALEKESSYSLKYARPYDKINIEIELSSNNLVTDAYLDKTFCYVKLHVRIELIVWNLSIKYNVF